MTFLTVPDHQLTPDVSVLTNLCNNGTCCDFRYSFQLVNPNNLSRYHYALAVFNGIRSYSGLAVGGVIACAIIACPTTEIATCGTRNESLIVAHQWTTIEISGSFPHDDGQYFYMPNSLDTSIMPLAPSQFKYDVVAYFHSNGSETRSIKMTAAESVTELLAFGVYGRNFNLDSGDEKSAAPDVGFSMFLMISVLAIVQFFE